MDTMKIEVLKEAVAGNTRRFVELRECNPSEKKSFRLHMKEANTPMNVESSETTRERSAL